MLAWMARHDKAHHWCGNSCRLRYGSDHGRVGGGLWLASGDEADTATEGQISPEPGDHRGDAIAQPDQKPHVHETPQPPGRRTPEFDTAKIGYRRLAADSRETAPVAVDE